VLVDLVGCATIAISCSRARPAAAAHDRLRCRLRRSTDRGYHRWMHRRSIALASLTVALSSLAVAAAVAPARADVADSAAGGFSVKQTVTVAAPAAKAWSTLIEPRGWWDKSHTWSGDANNLTLSATPGGCFCEKLAGGGGVHHMTVVYADPGKLLRLTGGLGPLQDLPVTAVMTFKLTEAQGKTTLELTYKVGGYAPGGLAALAAPVNGVLGEQLARWKRRVETGKP
jgi:uncharacterized protein YndB with AHSA1/START domain